MVPYLDLKAQYKEIKDEINHALQRVLDSAQFVLGPEAKAFEEEFAAFSGVKHGIGVNSGTSALHLALLVKMGQLGPQALAAYPTTWQEAVKAAPVQGLTGLIRGLARARRLRASQVNWQSTLDHLMMQLLEERIKWRQLSA